MATTHTSNQYFEVVDIRHSKLKSNKTRHMMWEKFIGYCKRERVKMTSMLQIISSKAGSYTDSPGIPCV